MLVARELPERLTDCSGNKWQLADISYKGVADAVSTFLEKQRTAADIQILKEEQNRLILRVGKSPNPNSGKIIAKVFPLYNLRLQLKCLKLSYADNRFGFGEAHNLLYARSKGFRVPSVLGCGWINVFPGVVKYSIVLLEDFGNLKTFYELFKVYRKDQDRCLALLNSMNDSFLKFYQTGCSMVNFHTKDAVFDGQCPIIYDFEYGIFRGKPNIRVLLFELAQFSGVFQGISRHEDHLSVG